MHHLAEQFGLRHESVGQVAPRSLHEAFTKQIGARKCHLCQELWHGCIHCSFLWQTHGMLRHAYGMLMAYFVTYSDTESHHGIESDAISVLHFVLWCGGVHFRAEFRSKGRGDARFISVSKDPGKAAGKVRVVGWGPEIGGAPGAEVNMQLRLWHDRFLIVVSVWIVTDIFLCYFSLTDLEEQIIPIADVINSSQSNSVLQLDWTLYFQERHGDFSARKAGIKHIPQGNFKQPGWICG